MSVSMPLEKLSAHLYDCYHGPSGGGGIPFFAPFLAALSNYSPSDVIAFQVKSYSLRYVEDFLLSAPNFVGTMDSSAWARAFALASPRPSQQPWDVHMEGQGDIYFICKYLRLDAVEFALKRAKISRPDKETILRKAQAFGRLLTLDEVDEEDLDGLHFVSKAYLENIANKLVYEGWSRLANDPEEIVERFAQLSI